MGKMNELSQVIIELKECGKSLINIADSLQEIFSAPAEKAIQNETEEKKAPAKPALTFIDVRKLLSEKSRAGHTEAVKTLLQKYGANKLSELSESDYASVVAEAEVL